MTHFFLCSQRLGFSHWTAEDLPYAEFLWGNPLVSRYISKEGIFAAEEIQARLSLEIENFDTVQLQYFPIFELATGRFIGCCGLRPYGEERKDYEIGIHLHPLFWELGYGFEAMQAMMTYAVEHLTVTELYAGHHPENIASKGLLLKLGFQQIGEEFYPPTQRFHPLYHWQPSCQYMPSGGECPHTADTDAFGALITP